MSKKLTFTYLSEPDVRNAGLTLSETVDLCKEALRQHGLKKVENPPKFGVHTREDSFIHSMPGYLKETDVCGIKWVSGYPANMKQRLPMIVGMIILNNPDNGFPTAVLGGTYITGIRTAAVSGVSVQQLARKDAEVLAIVGTGVQGKFNSICIPNYLPSIKKIRYYDDWAPSLKSFKEQIQPRLPNVIFEEASSLEDAVRSADVLVCSTGTLTKTVYYCDWVKPGALVLPIHMGGWEPDVMHKFDKCVVDDWNQINTRLPRYTSNFDAPYAELGEIVSGKKPGRENNEEKIINFNYGLAIEDMMCAHDVVEKAKKKGLGVELELMDLSAPIPLPPV